MLNNDLEKEFKPFFPSLQCNFLTTGLLYMLGYIS